METKNNLDEQKPIRLLKLETLLPANILDVQYYQTFEFGLMQYIVVQNDMFEDINDKHTFWIFFTEEAEDLFYDYSDKRISAQLHPEFVDIMKDYVKKAFADKNSVLAKLFEQRKQEWESKHPKEETDFLRREAMIRFEKAMSKK